MTCPYCLRPRAASEPRRCPACEADLTDSPTRLGMTALSILLAGYASVALAVHGWCFRPTGWLHPVVDPFVRGAEHAVGSRTPFATEPVADLLFQILLPAVPLAALAAGLRRSRSGTRATDRG